MKSQHCFLLIFLSITISSSFRIQGLWTVSQIKDFPVIQQTVSMEIQDYVYHNSEVQQKIIFSGCKSFQYDLQIIQNNLFIKYSTFQLNQSSNQSKPSVSSCSNNILSMYSNIQARLSQAFYFQIFGNYLVFLNPKNQILFKFQRQQSIRITNLRGVWNLYRLKSTQISQSVQIADTQISLCRGNLTVGYLLSGKYQIKTRLINYNGCDVQNLKQVVLSSAFYRRVGTGVQIYNSNQQLVLQLNFLSELDLTSVQQERQSAIQKAKKAEQQALQIKDQSIPTSNSQSSTMNNNNTSKSPVNEDLVGKWIPKSVFGIPLSSTPVYLIFTTNQISYNGGCNSYRFQYKVNDSTGTLQIGQNMSSSNKCAVDDDGLYTSAIIKINKYSIAVKNGIAILKMLDSGENNVYQLEKTIQSNSSSITLTNLTPQISIQSGKYIFLIITRRDLPRKFCNITQNKIIYQGCNTIQHTYKATSNTTIQISGGLITNKNCTNNNDQIMFNAFNSIKIFQKGDQAGSYMFKNSKNQQIINLSQF